MYLSATIYHIRKRTALGKAMAKNPLHLLSFMLNGMTIESKWDMWLWRLACGEKKFREWKEMNARVSERVRLDDERFDMEYSKKKGY